MESEAYEGQDEIFEKGKRANDFFRQPVQHYKTIDSLFENGKVAEDVQIFLSQHRMLEALTDKLYLSSVENRRDEESARRSREINTYKRKIDNALKRGGQLFRQVRNTPIEGNNLVEVMRHHQKIMGTLESFVELYSDDAVRKILPGVIRRFAEAKQERNANASKRFGELEKLKKDYLEGEWKASGLFGIFAKQREQNALDDIAKSMEKAILDACKIECGPLLGTEYASIIDDIRDFSDDYDNVISEEQKLLKSVEGFGETADRLSPDDYMTASRILAESKRVISLRNRFKSAYLSHVWSGLRESAADVYKRAEAIVDQGNAMLESDLEKLRKALVSRTNNLGEDERLIQGCQKEISRVRSEYAGLYSDADFIEISSKYRAAAGKCSEARGILHDIGAESGRMGSAINANDIALLERLCKNQGTFYAHKDNPYVKSDVKKYLALVRTAEKMLKNESRAIIDGLRITVKDLNSAVKTTKSDTRRIEIDRDRLEELTRATAGNLADKIFEFDDYKETAEAEKKTAADEFGEYRRDVARGRKKVEERQKELSDKFDGYRQDAEQREKTLQQQLREKEEEIVGYKAQMRYLESKPVSGDGTDNEIELLEVKQELVTLQKAYESLEKEKRRLESKHKKPEYPVEEIVKKSDIPSMQDEPKVSFLLEVNLKGVPVDNSALYRVKEIVMGERAIYKWREKLEAVNEVPLPPRDEISRTDENFLGKLDEFVLRSAKEGVLMKHIAYCDVPRDLVNRTLSRIRNYLRNGS